jgi:hypothetical protein
VFYLAGGLLLALNVVLTVRQPRVAIAAQPVAAE